MTKQCSYCLGSGLYIYYNAHDIVYYGTGDTSNKTRSIDCPHCSGLGWIDDEQLFTVPRKYVKDEYFKERT